MQNDAGGTPSPGAFRHEHIVRINDPANAGGESLTREQLWTGLWQTIVAPFAFDPSVDECTVDHVGSDLLQRRLTRGGRVVTDAVEIVPSESLTILAGGAHAGSRLRIAIEEPAPEALFVRFTYEVASYAELPAEQRAALKAAYEASDVDRIRQVRRYVARDGESR
jgi:hypothetical protein